jgi:TolB-like protein/Tfp pilus assembly protein PilF/class 3 adenylate cyclase
MGDEAAEISQPEIAHVLTIDVVGYSKLLIDAQTKLMSELNDVVRQSTRFRVADAAGKLIRLPTGDGMALVFFGSEPEAAMECAVEIATALKARANLTGLTGQVANEEEGVREIKARMGIHSGPVNRVVDLNEQPNVAGAGIDIAQRVMDCGDAGHILLSKRIAYDLAPLSRWNAHLYELGEMEVKHGEKISLVNFHNDAVGNAEVPSKIKRARAETARREKLSSVRRQLLGAALLLSILAIAAGIYLYAKRATHVEPATPLPPPDKSIAVLPFVDLSAARDQEYFCDGISEEILDALAKVEGLRVVARTSSFSFKGKNADVSEIGRKLNVASILEGSLRRDGNHIRVDARLISAGNGFEVWSGKIDKEMQGVFAMQDEITRAIVDALKIKLAGVPRVRPPQNSEAYDLYLQGLFFSNKSDEESLRKSLDLFQRALERDPKLARAWTGIAKDWSWLADAYVRPLDGHPRSQAAASKALALDERDAEAHAYFGETKRILNYDFKGEEAELTRALEIDPNSAAAHLFMALCQSAEGNRDNGLKEIRTAIRLDPLSPIIGSMSVTIYVANDRFDEALAEAKRTMEIDPNYIYFEPNLALVYREQGKLKQALEIYQRLEQTRHQPSAGLAITYARLGRKEDARRALAELIRVANNSYFPGEAIASVYVALGENDEAFRWLDRAIKEHSGAIHGIGVEREFRALHSDARFAEVLRRIGLDPAKILQDRQ